MDRRTFSGRLRHILLLALITPLIASCSDVVGTDPAGLSVGTHVAGPSLLAGEYTGESCTVDCIRVDEGEYFAVTGMETRRAGINRKQVSYSAYNTPELFVVNVTYEIISGRSKARATIIIDIDGDEVVFEDVAHGSTVTHEVSLPAGWQACDVVHYTVRQEGLGQPIEFEDTYALVPACPVASPVLWNRLGSEEQVATGEIGPDGTIVGAVNFDHHVMFGKGITPNTGYAGSGVDFPTTVLHPERGTVEMWAKFYHDPLAYSHGVYGLVNASHWEHNPLSFDWYNERYTRGRLQFVMQFNGNGLVLRFAPFEPELGEPVHLAIVWDRSGIDGSDDRMRIYVDGAMVATGQEDSWGTSNASGHFRVATTWDGSFDTDRYSVENLKVWDFARTDFSDRFVP